ncbi:hypothetical protein [Sinorhizobium sp. BJ1]|uniref:hypothetical protein n=1 Tax=Sinorhizobium sp. BJ1 TaxID=2035455 RepID=UPI0026D3C612
MRDSRSDRFTLYLNEFFLWHDICFESLRVTDQQQADGESRNVGTMLYAGTIARPSYRGTLHIGKKKEAVFAKKGSSQNAQALLPWWPTSHAGVFSRTHAFALSMVALQSLMTSEVAAVEIPLPEAETPNFMLSNGMEVVVIPDHRAPIVTQMVWSADEPPGKSGIAHSWSI